MTDYVMKAEMPVVGFMDARTAQEIANESSTVTITASLDEATVIDNNGLTVKQELFCRFYTQNTELFGNATLSYAEAYGYDLENADKDDELIEFSDGKIMTKREKNDREFRGEILEGKTRTIEPSTYSKLYHTCGVSAHHTLKNPKIDKRIIVLLNELMEDSQVDAEIAKVIKQNRDLGAKMRAIGEYNKLKQRIVDKVDHTTKGEKIAGFSFVRIEDTAPEKLPEPQFAQDAEETNTDNQTHT